MGILIFPLLASALVPCPTSLSLSFCLFPSKSSDDQSECIWDESGTVG